MAWWRSSKTTESPGSSSLMPTSVTAAPSRPRMRRRLGAPRTAFLRAWIGSPGHVGCALVRDGGLAGWGVIRPCRKGRKIGPLVADDRATAEVVLSALLARVGGGELFLDVQSLNRDAVALAQDLGLVPVFETARMYTGAIPPLRLERGFGVTTFELGECPANNCDVALSLLGMGASCAQRT